jgi:transposase
MVFKRWLGGANYTYNHALHDIKRKKASPQFNSLVVSYANDCDRYGNRRLPEFLSFTPTEIRKAALNDLTAAYDAAKTNRRLGNISQYEVNYRRKKKQRSCFSMSIPYESIQFYIDEKYPDEYKVELCPSKMKECMTNTLRKGKTKTKSILDECRLLQEDLDVSDYYCIDKENNNYKKFNTRIDIIDKKLKQNISPKETTKKESVYKLDVNTSIRVARLSRPGRNKSLDNLINSSSLNYNCRLCYKYGFWYLHIPYIRTSYPEPKIDNQDMVALDPGFKTFQTYFSSSGKYGKYQHDERRLKRICSMLDYYNWSLTNWHKPKYVRYKTDKLYRKQLHLVDEMHRKIIQDLTSQYNWIFLPSFETQDMMAGKSYNKKHREAKRHAYQLSHFKFKTRLINRCEQLENCKLLIVSEAYTTKTCTRCGWVWESMTTKDRMFKCKQCELIMDRDIHAARNILIRNLTG